MSTTLSRMLSHINCKKNIVDLILSHVPETRVSDGGHVLYVYVIRKFRPNFQRIVLHSSCCSVCLRMFLFCYRADVDITLLQFVWAVAFSTQAV